MGKAIITLQRMDTTYGILILREKGRLNAARDARLSKDTTMQVVELLLASPLRRALQTCLIAMEPSVSRGLRIIALPMAEEVSDAPSDTGSPPEELRAEFGFGPHVDFDHVQHGWWLHEGEYATDPKSLLARAEKLRRWIRGRPEREIVLVAHGFFNHYLTGEVNEKGEQSTSWWREAELRTYRFVDGDAPAYQGGKPGDWAMLEETEDSVDRRKGEEEGEREDEGRLKLNHPAKRKDGLDNYQINAVKD